MMEAQIAIPLLPEDFKNSHVPILCVATYSFPGGTHNNIFVSTMDDVEIELVERRFNNSCSSEMTHHISVRHILLRLDN